MRRDRMEAPSPVQEPQKSACDDGAELLTSAALVAANPHMLDGVYACAVEEAARIVGQKWTLQIVNVLMDFQECRFCELQDALGGVNPSTLSTRLKMLEEQGIIERTQVSNMPPHVVYRLTTMGDHLSGVIRELTLWSRTWLCGVAGNEVLRSASHHLAP